MMYEVLELDGRLEMKGREPRPTPVMVVRQDNPLEVLRTSLAEKFKSTSIRLDEKEKQAIQEEINRVQYPFPVKDFLFYINAETAKVLATSTHPIVREWGNAFVNFYSSDPLNKHTQPETGLVVAKRDGIQGCAGTRTFTGNGVWSYVDKDWVVSPGSKAGFTRHTQISMLPVCLNFWLYTGNTITGILAINPPKLSNIPFKLLSPLHVATLIGDMSLIQSLLAKGARIEDDCNHWHMTPLDMAIHSEQIEVIDFLFPKMSPISKAKALKTSVEKSSFAIIEKLLHANVPIMDETLKVAKMRDENLSRYLEIARKVNTDRMFAIEGAFKTALTLLSYPEAPIPLLVELVKNNPDVVNTMENGNTLLHSFVIEKNSVAVKAWLTAIFTVRFQKKSPAFDGYIEKKNSAGKTVLTLALDVLQTAPNNEQYKELVNAVMMYGDPLYTYEVQRINQHNIDTTAIMGKRTELVITTVAGISELQEVQTHVGVQNSLHVGILAHQQETLAET